MEVRGKQVQMFTPTRTLPHQGGGKLFLFLRFSGDEPAMQNLFVILNFGIGMSLL
jgi:hypothetical protein